MHADYFTVTDTYTDWKGYEHQSFLPNARQAAVIEAVQAALDAGLYYTVDVRRHCAESMALTPDADALQPPGHIRVEGGCFGMDCYYARGYIDARKKAAELREATEALRPAAGLALGVLVFNDYKRTTGVCIETVQGDAITFAGKRGAATVQGTGTALQLRHAIDRAHERKQRKDTFAEFAAKRAA